MNITTLRKRPTRLRNLRIQEVSSVDRGAGEGVRVMLHKRHADCQEDITKGFNALHESVASIIEDDGPFDKAEALAVTMAQAEDYFDKLLDPQDDDQAVIDEDDADYPAEQGGDQAKGKGKPMTAYARLQAKAAELRKADPKLTEHQAFAKVYVDKANAEIVNAERAERRGGMRKMDAADRIVARAAAIREHRNVSQDEAISLAKAANVQLVQAYRKGESTSEGGGGMLNDERNRVFDGSSTAGTPTSRGFPAKPGVEGNVGDMNDALLRLWQALKTKLPGLTVDDVKRMAGVASRDDVHHHSLYSNVGKAAQDSATERLHSRIAAMARQHPGMSFEELRALVLERNGDLAKIAKMA
jgi:hypothetical protein